MAPKPFTTSKNRSYGNTINVEGMLAASLSKATGEFAKDVRRWVREVRADNRDLETQIKRANLMMVNEAKEIMANRYHNELRNRNLSGYRLAETKKKNRRYGGGRMRRAIESDLFISVRGNKIALFDFKGLKNEVPHWYRLNFGSGKKPNSSVGTVGEMRMNVGGGRIYLGRGINFAGWGMSKKNVIPKGFYLGKKFDSSAKAWRYKQRADAEGLRRMGPPNGFYLDPTGSKSERYTTAPTRAYGFIEPAVKHINQEYAKFVAYLLRDAKRSLERNRKRVIVAK